MTLNQQRLHAIILQRKDCRDFIQNPGSFNLNVKNCLALTLELRPGCSLFVRSFCGNSQSLFPLSRPSFTELVKTTQNMTFFYIMAITVDNKELKMSVCLTVSKCFILTKMA